MTELFEISESHRDSLVQLLNNENVNKGLLQVPFPYTYGDADIFIKKCFNNKTDKDDFAFAIENDGIHVGDIGLHKKFEHSAVVGYWLGEQYWGRGFCNCSFE